MHYLQKMKNKTLEEAATDYSHNWHNITGLDPDDVSPFTASIIDFQAGAEWQAERSYSEEEVLDILFKHTEYFAGFGERVSLTEWFEQHKKK